VRIDLATGQFTVLANAGIHKLWGLALEPSGTALVTVDDPSVQLLRATLDDPYAPTSVVQAIWQPTGMAMDAGSALFLDCGGNPPNCYLEGRLGRVDLGTGAVTSVASGFNYPVGVAIEPNGNALVTDCGPSGGSCNTDGRLLRVTPAGAVSVVTSGFNFPEGIAVEPGGATALLAESQAGRLLRVNLSDGTYSIMASALILPHQVSLESGGGTAIVSAQGALVRVDLTSRTAATIVSLPGLDLRHAVEPGGAWALLSVLARAAEFAWLARVDLTTGGVDVLGPAFLNHTHSIVFTGGRGGREILVTDCALDGAIFRLTLP
jgi:DNA-binding beta-propeller fold protein YncE